MHPAVMFMSAFISLAALSACHGESHHANEPDATSQSCDTDADCDAGERCGTHQCRVITDIDNGGIGDATDTDATGLQGYFSLCEVTWADALATYPNTCRGDPQSNGFAAYQAVCDAYDTIIRPYAYGQIACYYDRTSGALMGFSMWGKGTYAGALCYSPDFVLSTDAFWGHCAPPAGVQCVGPHFDAGNDALVTDKADSGTGSGSNSDVDGSFDASSVGDADAGGEDATRKAGGASSDAATYVSVYCPP